MKVNTLELVENLYKRYESVLPIKNYFGLLAVYARAMAAVEAGNEAQLEACRAYLRQYPDSFPHPGYNFDYYEVGGNGKAWLVMKGLFDEEKENIRRYAEKVMAQPKDDDGVLCMRRCPEKKQIWIDVVHGTCPFMLYAGLTFGEQKYIDFAVDQMVKTYDVLLDSTTGLLHQARGFQPGDIRLVSSDHWGRGNGWGVLGLCGLVEYLPADSEHRPAIESRFVSLMTALIRYQNKRGVWTQNIGTPDAWDESSGTGMIAYGLGLGLRLGLLDAETFRVPFERAMEGIGKCFIGPDFATYMCCEGCLCPGEGDLKGTPEAYLTEKYPCKDECHSFGPLMLAALEAYRGGITEIDVIRTR